MEELNLIGKEILNYRIESLLGKGGMGNVYLAVNVNKHIDNKVAIKAIHPNLAESPVVRKKFINEARTLLAIDHPNIVHFLNFVENENGLYLIMEYVDGIMLDDFINNKNGLIVEAKAYDLFAQILDAFAYAHKKGIVHRDIKPANIILTNDNEGNFVVKVLDFGIARIISESNEEEKGMAIGTPMYMSPEQVKAEPIDERSDIYSLGVLLHQMLTGRAPYDSTTMSDMEIQHKVTVEPLPRMREYYQHISERMQKVVSKATAKVPAERYLNCASFRKDFLPKPPAPLWQKMAAAAVIFLILSCGWWYWDFNYHVKTCYYKDYVEQWGVPKGIGKTDYRHREGSYKFVKLKGKIVQIQHVNSKNNIIKHSDSEHTERIINARYYYTAGDKVNYVEIMDMNNKILYKKVYDENLKTVIFKYADEFGAEMCLAASTTKLFTNPFVNSQEEKGRISRYLLSYDENGYLNRLQYAGFQNVLVSDIDGLFGREYIVDQKGRVIEERYLGHDRTPKANKTGLAIKKFEYDKNDDWTKVTYFAANGELSSDGNDCPVVALDYDKWGNRIKETYYDGDGNLTLRKDINIAGFSYTRDEEGYRIEQFGFGTDSEPSYYGNYGFASMTHEYDEYGRVQKTFYKDMEGNLVVTKNGFAIKQNKNDKQGNVLEEMYYDENNQPCETYGFFKWIAEFDALGNQTSVFYYNVNDSLCLAFGSYAGFRQVYNDKNMLVEWSYFGADNQPYDVNGVYSFKYEYDPRGNEIKRSFYSADGKTLTLSDENIAGWESKYDDNGNETERKFFDTNRRPTSGNLGYASWIAIYNVFGFMDEKKFLDNNGQAIYVKSFGYAGIRYKYDNRGNITEIAYYDKDERPALGPKGFFRAVSEFNNRNQKIEERYYNAANRLFAPKQDKYAMIRYKYDNKGNQIENSFFNEKDTPVCKSDGYATHKSEFDPMSRIIRQTYFDENGQPTKPSVMVPEVLVKYDIRGNRIYIAAADGHGNLIVNPQTGWAVQRSVYDIRGRLLENSVYDKFDKPCLSKDNVYKVTNAYNTRGKATEYNYYGVDNTLRKENFAILRNKYDERGILIEQTYFNYLDKPVDAHGIVHKIIYKNDEQGNYYYQNIYKANGTLYGQREYNHATKSWEWVETKREPKSNWRQEVLDIAEGCPMEGKDNVELQSITLNSNGFKIIIRFMEASKYSLSDSQMEKFKNDYGLIFIMTTKEELKMPDSTRITVVGVDKENRELYSITN